MPGLELLPVFCGVLARVRGNGASPSLQNKAKVFSDAQLGQLCGQRTCADLQAGFSPLPLLLTLLGRLTGWNSRDCSSKSTEKQQLGERTVHSSAWKKKIPDTQKCHLPVTLPAEGHFHASLGRKCLNKLQFKWKFIWEGKAEVSCGHGHSPGMRWVTGTAVARVCR